MRLRRCPLVLLIVLLAAPHAPARAVEQTPLLPLGTAVPGSSGDASCPAPANGHAEPWSCSRVSIQGCTGVSASRVAFVAVSPLPAGARRGVVVTHSGGSGGRYWSEGDPLGIQTVDDLYRVHGFQVVQLRWQGGWNTPVRGEPAGPAKLACRPATLIDHVHDLYWPAPLAAPEPGQCGFCLVGASGGSAAIAYALSHYGLDAITDGLIPHGGPTHAAIAKGCGPNREYASYRYESPAEFDQAYGWTATTGEWAVKDGPCARRDPAFMSTWANDSVDAPGADMFHPSTRVHVILGEADWVQRSRVQREYAMALAGAGSPMVNVRVIPGMEHQLDAAGHQAVVDAVLWAGPSGPCANGLDDDWDGTTDFGAGGDPGCSSAEDLLERGEWSVCDDGVDQDGDGDADFALSKPQDPGCSALADTTETNPAKVCDDGLDNDQDGFIDFPDDLTCTTGGSSSEGSAPGGPESISFVSTTVSVTERDPGATTARCSLSARLSAVPSTKVTVSFATSDGTALAGSDYVARSGNVSWAAGAQNLTRGVRFDLVADTVVESTETFTVTLSNPQPATTTITTPTATCTIHDDADG